MDEKLRRRWFVFSLLALCIVVAGAAVAIGVGKWWAPTLVPIAVADATTFVRSDLVLFNPRLPFPIDPNTGPPPDPATLRGKTVFSVRGTELARAIEPALAMSLANPGAALTGNPKGDTLFHRLVLKLKADEYELLRFDAQGHSTRLPTQDVDVVVIKENPR